MNDSTSHPHHLLHCPSRIYIIGGPGSGKSVLSHQLSRCYKLPIYNLDSIAFDEITFVEQPLAERTAAVSAIVIQPTWIAEGIFLGWIDPLLDQADVIIWLDHVRWPTAYRRIVQRFVQSGIREIQRQPGRRKFTRFHDYYRHTRHLLGVFFSSRSYYYSSPAADLTTMNRKNTSRTLQRHWAKVIHCRTEHDVRQLTRC